MDFWEEVKVGNVGLGNDGVGDFRGQVARDDEIRDSLGENGLWLICRTKAKG